MKQNLVPSRLKRSFRNLRSRLSHRVLDHRPPNHLALDLHPTRALLLRGSRVLPRRMMMAAALSRITLPIRTFGWRDSRLMDERIHGIQGWVAVCSTCRISSLALQRRRSAAFSFLSFSSFSTFIFLRRFLAPFCLLALGPLSSVAFYGLGCMFGTYDLLFGMIDCSGLALAHLILVCFYGLYRAPW